MRHRKSKASIESDYRNQGFCHLNNYQEQNRDRLFFTRDDDCRRRPSSDFDMAEVRRQLRKLEVKRRKLNSAIQQANFNSLVEFRGESINPVKHQTIKPNR